MITGSLLLNTELKILARVFPYRLQLIISDLIGPEQNYAVKGDQSKTTCICFARSLRGLKDNTKAPVINLNQSKALEGWTIGFLRRFWRPPDSNRSSANESARCTHSQRYR